MARTEFEQGIGCLLTVYAIVVIGTLCGIAYVAWHFISKFW